MRALAHIHGEIVPLDKAKVSALDRGFLFGDAVYEVLRVYAGKPWLEREHWQRLEHSLQAIRIAGVDLDRLARRMHETIAAGPFTEATVYIQITRGSAPRKHPFPANVEPFELLFVQDFIDPYVEARAGGAAVITHADLRWRRCDIKSTNLLANVLAMQCAIEAGGIEALLYQPDGHVTEGTHTSLFGVAGGAVLATPQDSSILPGITKGLVFDLARKAGIPVREQGLTRAALFTVDELFLTGTTSAVVPIVRVDDRAVNQGTPGPITRRLQQAYAEAVRAFVQS